MAYQEPDASHSQKQGKKQEEGVSWPWQTTVCLFGMAVGVSVGLAFASLRVGPPAVAPAKAALTEVSSKLTAATGKWPWAHKERRHGRWPATEAIQAGGGDASAGVHRGAAAAAAEEAAAGKPPSPKKAYDLLIVIPVAGKEVERRDAIRATWMKYLSSPLCEPCSRHKVGTVFIAGNEGDVNTSRAEGKAHGDLDILEDFGQEQYYTNRAEKTLRSIRHAVQHYNFTLLLKTDSDSWVFLDRLLQDFDDRGFWNRSKLYAGDFLDGTGAAPSYDKESKWYDPLFTKITGMSVYPKHAKGAGYLISRQLAEELAVQPDGFWQDLPSEDVSMGVWLFGLQHDKEKLNVWISPNCNSNAVIDHYITPEIMRQRWTLYEKTGSPCEKAVALKQLRSEALRRFVKPHAH